jgi:hypothetical protein
VNDEPSVNPTPEWISRGKTVRELISELSSFENQDLEVLMTLDNGKTVHCVSLVGKQAGACVLYNLEAANREGIGG